MNLEEFKKEYVRTELGITSDYGRMTSVIDFGNVNYWFEEDQQDADNTALGKDEKLVIDLEGLENFSRVFSSDIRFYYGHDAGKLGSINFIVAAKHAFGKNRVFTKPIQFVRHHLKDAELESNTRTLFSDNTGVFIKLPKCNFDVEITVDVIRKIDSYDTLVLFSGDADFLALARYLHKKNKKVILIKGGTITSALRGEVDLVVNAQKIKKYIAAIEKNGVKQKPGS